jgi:hypothetical protein
MKILMLLLLTSCNLMIPEPVCYTDESGKKEYCLDENWDCAGMKGRPLICSKRIRH